MVDGENRILLTEALPGTERASTSYERNAIEKTEEGKIAKQLAAGLQLTKNQKKKLKKKLKKTQLQANSHGNGSSQQTSAMQKDGVVAREEAQPASGAAVVPSLVDLPPSLLEKIGDYLFEHYAPDDVTALRGTCTALWEAILPTGEDGEDELTPAGATVSMSRLKWAIRQCGWPKDNENKAALMRSAGRRGHLQMLKWAKKEGALAHSRVFEGLCWGAAEQGHLDVLKWAKSDKKHWDKDVQLWQVCLPAAEYGQLEVLKWAKEIGAQWEEMLCEYAAEGGQLEVLKWLRENGAPWDEQTCAAAAGEGHLELLKWLRENGAPWDWRTCAAAAGEGQLEALEWAREKGAPWDERICASAAGGYKLCKEETRSEGVLALYVYGRMVQGGNVTQTTWDNNLEDEMVFPGGGHLEVLKWARENGAPWDWRTCQYAALAGHLEVLKWARENGAPWNEWTCTGASGKGHLDVLKWARENGAPWDEEVCIRAAQYGHLEMLKWARQNGAPWDRKEVMARAKAEGHLELLKWARKNKARQ